MSIDTKLRWAFRKSRLLGYLGLGKRISDIPLLYPWDELDRYKRTETLAANAAVKAGRYDPVELEAPPAPPILLTKEAWLEALEPTLNECRNI